MKGESRRTLVIFARYPRLGAVKTRLSAGLGADAALAFHELSIRRLLERMAEVRADRRLYLGGCTADEAEELTRSLGSPNGFDVFLQSEGDLGSRLTQAFHEVWNDGGRVVFLGSDAPTVPVAYVEAAFDSLSHVPVVLGPATDGGYYLIGLDRPQEHLFRVDWGTDRVLVQTVRLIEPGEVTLLPEWFDVDEVADLRRLRDGVETWP